MKAMKINAILPDGGIEIIHARYVFLIDIQRDGNHFWYVRATNYPAWNRHLACSHLDALLREINAVKPRAIQTVP